MRYHDVVVGDYFVDLLAEDVLPVELKAAKALDDVHRMQCIDYLKTTGLRLCLLINSDRPCLKVRRIAHDQ